MGNSVYQKQHFFKNYTLDSAWQDNTFGTLYKFKKVDEHLEGDEFVFVQEFETDVLNNTDVDALKEKYSGIAHPHLLDSYSLFWLKGQDMNLVL